MNRWGRRGSWTLVELVVVMVILIALAAWLLPRYLGSSKDSLGRTTVQAPMERAKGVDCVERLHQIRLAITMSQQTNERFPASLQDMPGSGLSRDRLVCPVSKQPYFYTPATGQVVCPYPPHRSF